MTGSVELPTMFVIGWLAFGETLGSAQLVAGALVLLAIALAPSLAGRAIEERDDAAEAPPPSGDRVPRTP